MAWTSSSSANGFKRSASTTPTNAHLRSHLSFHINIPATAIGFQHSFQVFYAYASLKKINFSCWTLASHSYHWKTHIRIYSRKRRMTFISDFSSVRHIRQQKHYYIARLLLYLFKQYFSSVLISGSLNATLDVVDTNDFKYSSVEAKHDESVSSKFDSAYSSYTMQDSKGYMQKSLGRVVAMLGKQKQWVELVQLLKKRADLMDTKFLNATMRACVSAEQWDVLIELWNWMHLKFEAENGVANRDSSPALDISPTRENVDALNAWNNNKWAPNFLTYKYALLACCNLGLASQAMRIFNSIKESPFASSLLCEVSAPAQGKDHYDFLDHPPRVYTSVLGACAQATNSKYATEIYKEMIMRNMVLSAVDFAYLFQSYTGQPEMEKLDPLLHQMRQIVVSLGKKTKECSLWRSAYNAVAVVYQRLESPQKVLDLMDEMVDLAVYPDIITFNTCLRAYETLDEPYKVMEVLYKLPAKYMVSPDRESYEICVRILEKNKKYGQIMKLFDRMKENNFPPRAHTYVSCINVCKETGRWRFAVRLVQEMKALKMNPSSEIYTKVIQSCEKARKWDVAVLMINRMRKRRYGPTIESFQSVFHTCHAAGRWRECLDLFREMIDLGIEPNEQCFIYCIDVAIRYGQWVSAYMLMLSSRKLGWIPSQTTYKALLHVLERKNLWIHAMRVLREMQLLGLETDNFCYRCCLNTLGSKKQPEQAFKLLDELRSRGVTIEKETYESYLRVCALAGNYNKAFETLDEMKLHGYSISLGALNYSIDACARGKQFALACKLFFGISSLGFLPDTDSFNAIMRAGQYVDNLETVNQFFQRMKQLHIFRNTDTYNIVMVAHFRSRQHEQVMDLFKELREVGVQYDLETLGICIKSCKILRKYRYRAVLIKELKKLKRRMRKKNTPKLFLREGQNETA